MEFYMKRAIELAKKGIGSVNPNPLVGAVIVKNDRIIGEGYHQIYGGPHAEVNAISNSISSVKDSTMYVTLEPCIHFGKTPPCAHLIVEKQIKKVIIGIKDPNPLVAGKGIDYLKQMGVEVEVGLLEKEILELNEVFLHFIKNHTPYILMKTAMTLDGKIATYSRDSKWVSCKETLELAHYLRKEYMGILVGVETIVRDNPRLTTRLKENARNPIRIIVDSKGRIPLNAFVISEKAGKTIIASTELMSKDKRDKLEELGVEIIICKIKNEQVDLKDLMIKLGKAKIDSIMVEGGGNILFSLLREGLINKVISVIAPKLIGGKDAITPIEGQGIEKMIDAISLQGINYEKLGDDLVIKGYIK